MARVIDRLRPFNPLWSTRTALPPLILAGAKLLVLYLFHFGLHGPGRGSFLPLLPWLDSPIFGPWFQALLNFTAYTATAALVFNVAPRAGAFAVGFTTFWMILADRTTFSNSTTFAAFLLILIGLYTPRWGLLLLRVQVVLLYTGAALNKLLDPHWRSGQFIEALMREDYASHWFHRLGETHPALLLSWLIILIEFLLALGFALPRFQRLSIALGLCFHLGMLAFTDGALSQRFGFLMPVAYLLLVSPSFRRNAAKPNVAIG